MTYDVVRQAERGVIGKTYVSEDDGRNNGIVVTHADVTLELAVPLSEGCCAGMEFGLAECGHGGIADGGGGNTDSWWDGGGQEGIKGVEAKLGEHERGLMVVWTDVPVGEGVEGVEEGGGCLCGCKTSGGVPWDGGEEGKSESRCGAQGCHGWNGEKRKGTVARKDIGGRYSPSQVGHRVDYAFVRLVSVRESRR